MRAAELLELCPHDQCEADIATRRPSDESARRRSSGGPPGHVATVPSARDHHQIGVLGRGGMPGHDPLGDHGLVRQGLEAVLSSAADIALVGQAADGSGAVDVVGGAEPDVVLMDLQLPGLLGPEATREILAARPDTAVLVLTMFEDDDTVHAAMAAGAVGYLLKGADGEDILAAVRSAAAGQAVFGAAIAHRL